MSLRSANFATPPVLPQDSQGPQSAARSRSFQRITFPCIRPLTGWSGCGRSETRRRDYRRAESVVGGHHNAFEPGRRSHPLRSFLPGATGAEEMNDSDITDAAIQEIVAI